MERPEEAAVLSLRLNAASEVNKKKTSGVPYLSLRKRFLVVTVSITISSCLNPQFSTGPCGLVVQRPLIKFSAC